MSSDSFIMVCIFFGLKSVEELNYAVALLPNISRQVWYGILEFNVPLDTV